MKVSKHGKTFEITGVTDAAEAARFLRQNGFTIVSESHDTRSPTLREPERPFAGAGNEAAQVQCPECGYWVHLYEGNKVALRINYARAGKPYCKFFGELYPFRS